jgi:hypothetical protein
VRASGDAAFDDAARAAPARPGGLAHGEEALKSDREALRQLNARPRSDQERAADCDVRRRRYRPPSPRSGGRRSETCDSELHHVAVSSRFVRT